MEITISSASSSSCCLTLNSLRRIVWPQHRSSSKQSLPIIPPFMIVSKLNELQPVHPRRLAQYHPSIWDLKLIESLSTLSNPYTYELYGTRLEVLKRSAKCLLTSTKDPCAQLNLVCTMQWLGVAYHFEKEIEEVLALLYPHLTTNSLHTTALQFRVLRQHGFSITSDVFDKFRSSDGRFMDSLSSDMEGLLSLYEASHLAMHGENILEEGKDFSIRNLKSLMGKLDSDSAKQVKQSLEIPLYWRMPRVEARSFIDVYQRDMAKNLTLLELAKLDNNLVQYVYQQELIELARWWRDLGFQDKLAFSRDRLIEINYLWAIGSIFEPQLSKCRIGVTKFVCILSAIDDMYDMYGSLDELECFTDAVDRWKMEAMEDLPEYMRICYLAMLNFANEVVFDVLKDHGFNIFPYIKEAWENLCRSYLVERRWFSSGYTPTLDEYLENAWISVGGPSAIVHAYVLLGCTISKDALDCLKRGPELIYWASLITRLSDDLGTWEAESKRGDVVKSIECYMVQEGVSKEEAQDHIKRLISSSWKKLNEESAKSSLPKSVVKMSLNMARTAQCIYQHGDGIGISTGVIKDHLTSLIVKPIPIE
ncbi:probable terpene synthase 9 isoform X1 [Corylus avellana]|uniref:probable terpene synthase 9 isoform X1 n=1 Tax=Corylus avellana TaxID=13451 RepID=UPI00286AA562|nr:probable terpene synthase 9 isoform X1 [Corylus avellana]